MIKDYLKRILLDIIIITIINFISFYLAFYFLKSKIAINVNINQDVIERMVLDDCINSIFNENEK